MRRYVGVGYLKQYAAAKEIDTVEREVISTTKSVKEGRNRKG